MAPKKSLCAAALACLAGSPVLAATVNVVLSSDDGQPVENAVIELVPQSTMKSLPSGKLPAEAVVDQRHETFIPLVSLIRRGGRVIFTNNDTTMHQVYSFSDIKQFAFEIDEGQRSAPVEFDKAGVSAIGCNIHDQMITYVYVAATPWAALTNASGTARIDDVPPGTYEASIWHPRLEPGHSPPQSNLIVQGDSVRLAASIALSPEPAKHMHMQMY
jgi:plastocyanin